MRNEQPSSEGTKRTLEAGTGTLKYLGTGTLTLTGTNTYSGGTSIANGTIALVNGYEFGTGPVTVSSNGVAYNYSAALVTVTNAVNLNGGGFHTGGGNGGTKNIWAGPDSGSVTLVNNAVIGALMGSRNLNLNVSSISIGNNGSSTTYSGALINSGSLTKVGSGTFTLTGTNTYTGTTTINAGTLALSGNGSIASSNIIVSGGATFDVSGKTTAFTLGSSSTLTNSSVGAAINGNNHCTVGTLSLVNDGTNASFIQTNGTMIISASTVLKVNNTGAMLTVGAHPLIAAATTDNLGRVTGALPSVVLTGNGAAGAVSLQINGSGGLDLVVASTISPNPTSLDFTLNSGALTLTWPGDHLGWIAQSNALDLSNTNYWFDILDSQSATNSPYRSTRKLQRCFTACAIPFDQSKNRPTANAATITVDGNSSCGHGSLARAGLRWCCPRPERWSPDLAALAVPICTRAAIHLTGNVVSFLTRTAMARACPGRPRIFHSHGARHGAKRVGITVPSQAQKTIKNNPKPPHGGLSAGTNLRFQDLGDGRTLDACRLFGYSRLP